MLLFALTSLAIVNFQTAHVSIDGVDNVGNILSQVSKAVHRNLIADPEIGAITVYVRLQDVDLAEFKRRLALMAGATWAERSGVSSLRRTPAQSRRITEDRINALTPGLDAALAQLRPGLEPGNPKQAARTLAMSLRSEAQKQGAHRFIGPTDGLLTELLRSLGAKRLAGLRPFQIVLLSNNPSMPEGTLANCSEPISRFVTLAKAFSAEVSEEAMAGILDKYDFDRVVQGAHDSEAVGRVLVSLYPTIRTLFAILTVYDLQGKEITHATTNIALNLADTAIEISSAAESMVWPEPSRQALDVLARSQGTNGSLARIRDLLYEPLSLQAVPGLQDVASSRAANILCPLPDAVVTALFKNTPRTVGDFVATLAANGVLLSIGGSWLEGQLRPGALDPAQYLSRSALRQWVDASIDKTQNALRRAAALFGNGGDAASNGLVSWYHSTVWPALKVEDEPQNVPRWALKALGSCSEIEWDALEHGNTISIAGAMDRRRQIEQWSWQASNALETVPGFTEPDVMHIGSVAFPAGPPPSGTIQLRNGKEKMVGITIDGNFYWMRMLQVAYWLCDSQQPRPANLESAMKAISGQFNLGVRPIGQIVCALGPHFLLRCDQPNGAVASIAESANIDSWPADYLNELKSAVQDFLTQRASLGSTPPP